MNGRVYDPQIGRFVSADPRVPNLHRSQDLNRYAYVDNNPLNSIDPSGFDGGSPPSLPSGTTNFNIYWNPTAGWAGNAVIQQPSLEGAGNLPGALPSGSNPTGNADSTLYGSLSSGVLGGSFASVDGGLVTNGTDTSTTYTPSVGDVFGHFTWNDNETDTPSPFDAPTRDALELYLSSPVGLEVGTYAITNDQKINIAEVPSNSRYTNAAVFYTDADDVIRYSVNMNAFLAKATAAGALSDFTGLSASNLLADLFAHEIAHTQIGSQALGKPMPTSGPIYTNYPEELNAVRYGENPFREFIGAPLRETYTVGLGNGMSIPFLVPLPLAVQPGGN